MLRLVGYGTSLRATNLSTLILIPLHSKIRDLAAKFSQDVQTVWRPGGTLSHAFSSGHATHSGRLPLANTLSAAPIQDTHFLGHSYQASENLTKSPGGLVEQMDLDNEDDSDSESDGDEELFASINIEALNQRGKGAYTCPKGKRCDKGGVDKYGNVVVFDRNSSFAYSPSPFSAKIFRASKILTPSSNSLHCNKHRKPWVCTLDNCPNTPKKRRFARRDGLRRHKATVNHKPKGAELHIMAR